MVVSGGGHGQGAVGGADFECFLDAESLKQAEDWSRCESVTAAHAVENL